jgi:ribosomal protein S18 acetylase RimI-like enzyme
MNITLGKHLQLVLHRPLRVARIRRDEMAFILKRTPLKLIPTSIPSGYQVLPFEDKDFGDLLTLIKASGFGFTRSMLVDALQLCLPSGVFLVRHSESNALVSSMMARHLSTPEFLFGGRIDWLITDPAHRGQGLGKLSATLATNHLIKLGYRNIWVTTNPHRLDAIRIFTSLGYEPTPQTVQEFDWAGICARIARA